MTLFEMIAMTVGSLAASWLAVTIMWPAIKNDGGDS